ncbi:MAG: sulfatase-like hydrolase/transferase, partial [Acidobacteria bacterium]|nr:sulfatase-like hydrolase/transferase [Acidobacteriota bacterium]
DPLLERNGEPVRGKGYITDDLTDHALAFIEQNRNRPFFCYVPYNTPHSPFQVPDRFYDGFRDKPLVMLGSEPEREEPGKTRCALAMCENIDENVGRILRKLEELALADRTIVLYFSDNGPNSWRWNGGMKGRKGSLDEGGVRVPLLIRWPGHIKPGTRIPQIAGAIDLLPTLTDMAGVARVGNKPLDGMSLRPLLLGKKTAWPDRMIFSHQNGMVSVRTQRYRLDAAGRLFDMEKDSGQNRDVSRENPELQDRLARAVSRWKEEVLPNPPDDDRPFPVGDSSFPVTTLPARDAVPHGLIRRSASAPNCSFFTDWRSVDDRITWDVEVATAGSYEAVINYTCAKQDVGSTIELGFEGSTIRATVTEDHDPPLVGAEFDRVPREGESYVKDFKPLRLRVLRLEKGRGALTLRALSVAGVRVMDVRSVTLTLKEH